LTAAIRNPITAPHAKSVQNKGVIDRGRASLGANVPPLRAVDVPGYLLARGLISPKSIVDGDLVIRELSGRNRTFGAECSDATSYLLKQNAATEVTTAAGEGEVYRALSASPAMGPYLPRFQEYDTDTRVLVAEYFPDAEDLASYHRNRQRPPVRTASAIGAVLGSLHEMPLEQAPAVSRRRRPSVLSLHRPGPRMVAAASRAALELVRIVQGTDGFGPHLDALNRDWATTNLIHQDVRFKNFVWTRRSTTARRSRVKLIDWELACVGDPGWDIGSALGSYLSLWLASIPVTGSVPPAQSAELARCPLNGIQPAIRACWTTYVTQRHLDDCADALLPKVVRFAAARLIQTAFETAQDSTNLTADIILHLQVAFNIMQRPREAAEHLLGLAALGINESTGGDIQ
jgi:aminoglycoside phosphotransferase (APT) family kinase protein